jgi:hypothetical protein
VVIDNFHLISIAIVPTKAYAPLIIHPNAVLPCSTTLQEFQMIPWRRGQVAQNRCSIDLPQLSLCNSLNGTETRHSPALMELSRIWRTEALDHPM